MIKYFRRWLARTDYIITGKNFTYYRNCSMKIDLDKRLARRKYVWWLQDCDTTVIVPTGRRLIGRTAHACRIPGPEIDNQQLSAIASPRFAAPAGVPASHVWILSAESWRCACQLPQTRWRRPVRGRQGGGGGGSIDHPATWDNHVERTDAPLNSAWHVLQTAHYKYPPKNSYTTTVSGIYVLIFHSPI